jgi:membrane-bound lytic murein transglycosylase D
MSLSLSRVSRFVIGLTFFFFASPSAYSQYEEMSDVDADSAATAKLVAKSPYIVKNVTDKEINDRLSQMTSCVDLRNTRVVKSYIMHYLTRPEKTRRLLSKMVTYFPLFEKKLLENEVPDALKYLSVVESALNANAVSRVGASGLWQFMPATGLDYGMQINSAIDERNNVVKSTEGAAKYLKHLFNQYNDWALALAAYNSGPNRVNGAIKRAGSRNFWVIQRFLPEETRNYVPAFIAATYICNFYNEHNLEPKFPELDEQITDHITVYDGISFSAIAKATGLSYQLVSDLNPGFRRAYIPPSKRGYYLTLPKRVMPAMVRHLNGLGGSTYRLDGSEYANVSGDGITSGNQYYFTNVAVSETDLADRFAAKIGASGVQLRVWNNLANPYVYANQTVKIWHPVHVIKHVGGIDVAAAQKTEVPASPVRVPSNATAPKPSTAPATTVTSTKPSPNGGSTTVTTITRPATNPPTKPTVGATPAKPTTGVPVSTVNSGTSTTLVKPSAPTTGTAVSATPVTTKPTASTTIIKSSSSTQTQYLFHKVKDKETLGDLARRYSVSEDALMRLNNTAEVKAGMLVRIKELK